MQPYSNNKVRIALIIFILIIIVMGVTAIIVSILNDRNVYGNGIRIQNYNDKVHNLSKDYRDNIESSLYEIVNHNSDSDVVASEVKDAFIRDLSEQQNEIEKNTSYSGTFIVDIESLKQSYMIQYTYSSNPNNPMLSGVPIYVSCVNIDDIIYTEFNCKDLINADPVIQESPIINLLPHSTLSYSLRAVVTDGEVVIEADLDIPSSDLKGSTASKRSVVNLYKSEVTNWIKSNNLNPADYTIDWNYTNDGKKIERDSNHIHYEM